MYTNCFNILCLAALKFFNSHTGKLLKSKNIRARAYCKPFLCSYPCSKICKIFFVIFFQTPWLWNTRHCWYNYPYQVRRHYCLGFYTHKVSTLGQFHGLRQAPTGWATPFILGPTAADQCWT